MKRMIFVVALLVSATARGEVCKAQLTAWERAVERADKAKQALADYQNSSLAPLVPGQEEKQLQQLKDNVEAALADVKRTSDAHDRCLERANCKKWKRGWQCTIAGTYEKCCLDNAEPR